jgi:hypothetical protein
MIKKTIAGGISTLAIAGVLASGAATSAQAATAPGQAPAAIARTMSGPAAHVAPRPLYSKRFNFGNQLGAAEMKLMAASGDNEGLPPVGSVMRSGEFQAFEVQYKAGGTGVVYANYDVISTVTGNWLGNVTIKMSYGCFGDTGTVISDEQNLSGIIQITGDGYGNPELTWH